MIMRCPTKAVSSKVDNKHRRDGQSVVPTKRTSRPKPPSRQHGEGLQDCAGEEKWSAHTLVGRSSNMLAQLYLLAPDLIYKVHAQNNHDNVACRTYHGDLKWIDGSNVRDEDSAVLAGEGLPTKLCAAVDADDH